MLSSRLTDSIRASENKLSKKEKKKLAKIALEDVDIESCAPSDANSDDKVNKYINIVNKKLRTLRKRMVCASIKALLRIIITIIIDIIANIIVLIKFI